MLRRNFISFYNMKHSSQSLPLIKKPSHLEILDLEKTTKLGLINSELVNSEENSPIAIKVSPTKSIFLTFISRFLSGEKRPSRRAKTFKTICQPIMSAFGNYSENLGSSQPLTCMNFQEGSTKKKKKLDGKQAMFPKLKPNTKLNEFLEKEKARLEASKSERLLVLRPTLENLKISHKKPAKAKKKKLKKSSKSKLKKKVSPDKYSGIYAQPARIF